MEEEIEAEMKGGVTVEEEVEAEMKGGVTVEEEVEAETKGGVENIKLAGHTVSPLDVPMKSPNGRNPSNDGQSKNNMIGKEGGREADIVQERKEEKSELTDTGKGEGTRTGLGVVVGAGLGGENVTEQSMEGASSTPLSTNTQTTFSIAPTSTSSTTVRNTSPLMESLGTSTSTTATAPSPGNENEKEVVAEAVAGVVKQVTKLIDSLPQGAKSKNILSIGDSEEDSLAAEHSHPVVIAEKEKEEKGKKKEGNEEKGKKEEGNEEKGKKEEGKEEEEDKSGVQIKQLETLAGHETADSLSSIESDRQGSDVHTGVRAGVDAGVHAVAKGMEESQEGGHGDQGASEIDAKTGGSSIEDVSASPALLVSNSSSASSTNSSSLTSSLLPSDPSSPSFTNFSSLSPDLLPSTSSNSTSVSTSILPCDPSSPSSTNSSSLLPDLLPSSSSSNSSSLPPSLTDSESSSSPTSNSSSLSSSSTSNSTSSGTPGDGAPCPIPPASSSKPVPPPPTPAEIRMASQYMMIASAYIGRGDYELALNQLAKAEKKAENYPDMYMLRASVYQALGQVRKNCTRRMLVTLL